MESKTKKQGIDSWVIKCSDKSDNTIEAGISLDSNGEVMLLNFHFLEYLNIGGDKILDQTTKQMHLDKETANQLIKELREFKI